VNENIVTPSSSETILAKISPVNPGVDESVLKAAATYLIFSISSL